MKKRNGIAPIIAIIAILAAVLTLGFIVTQTDFVGSTVGTGSVCSFEPFSLNDQEFSTMQEAKTTYQQLGGDNWENLKKNAHLQVRDGVVKARVCEYS